MNNHPIIDQTRDQLAVTRWRLDPAASSAEFQVPHFWGLVTVKGHFERLDGWLEIDESRHPSMSTISSTAARASARPVDGVITLNCIRARSRAEAGWRTR